MDLFDLLLNTGLITTALVAYLIFSRRSKPVKFTGKYREPAWNFPLRLLLARFAVKRWKASLPKSEVQENPISGLKEGWDCFTIKTSSPDGATVFVSVRKIYGKPLLAEATVYIKLVDGTSFRLWQHPETLVGRWEEVPNSWAAGGLKITVLEPEKRLRVIFNGLLTNARDSTKIHAKFNLIWASATNIVRYPDDWSEELAAQALALEPWKDGDWPSTLNTWRYGSWHQWGTIQGRFQTFNSEGVVSRSEYLETRGVRERSWSPLGYQGLRRTVTISAAAKDGTAVVLRGFSYKDVLTLGYSGNVRFPDFSEHNVTGTSLHLADFCEFPNAIPKVYTINVSTKKRTINLVIRINQDGGRLFSGSPYEYEVQYRTISVTIDGEIGTGLLELGYESSTNAYPSYKFPDKTLRWLSEASCVVRYCATFDSRVAVCPNYVGGKGASLALLASVQKYEGYKVPPGYCITTKALEKHLETNPHILAAIKDIEAANEDYDENIFKHKCNKVVELFMATDITEDVKKEILAHLAELRNEGIKQNLGPTPRFAVRSSAVGEDSEALSAAGQNETVLGCITDEDVMKGVQQCWASMFAFTSVHYRRINGQECVCGGAVVVQALVCARAAGVLFTRQPDNGDPTRLLLSANYGLGESVVSGSVEPDTIIISRDKELTISKIIVGSKLKSIGVGSSGVESKDVSEAERKEACLSKDECLKLAAIGARQDDMWGAGRDIEWAVVGDEMFLLQARPITSLERWTEEELLHEMDFAIMADDEIITFANTGEVMPKPLTALGQDVIYDPLAIGTSSVMYGIDNKYNRSIVMTHYRMGILSYNSLYRVVPKKLDVTVKMLELAVHGHKVADERIHRTALRRRDPNAFERAMAMLTSMKTLLKSKKVMNETKRIVKNFDIDLKTNDPLKLLNSMRDMDSLLAKCCSNHCTTSTASTTTQLIAMMVLLEGAKDFSPEQGSEINLLLSSGGVLSAEVPQILAKLAKDIDASGKIEEFRALDPKEAMNWLNINLPKVHTDIWTFLETHGHRAIMEFDVSTKPWVLVPEDMIVVLQNMKPSSNDQPSASKSNKDILASLKTPKKSSTRRVLSWVLPLCQRAVRHREDTKAHLILAVHRSRLIARRIAKILVRQWYLPDEDLIYHFTVRELKEYIVTRDPALIKKALQRRQYYPSWCKLKFAEMQEGWVRPQQSKGPLVIADDVKIEATSVCGGQVIARACVIKDLSGIDELQKGDVLITHSTDIGWSPYFPLLSGIVTELGGLISHGAVIAREFGLPCIVGATDATDMFKTGDMVHLNGNNSTLQRVKLHSNKPETNDTQQ